MKVIVTGGTGFVGPAIVQALVDAGHTVRVLNGSRAGARVCRARRPCKGT